MMKTTFLPVALLIALLLPLAVHAQPEALAANDELTRLGLQLKDPNPQVRLQAIQELGKKYDQRASEWLTAALNDPDPRLRAAAAVGLGNQYYLAATPALLQLLGDADETVRAPAVKALGMHRNWQAVDPLLKALKDPAPAVRAGAVTGLSRIHAAWALDAMSAALADPSPLVRSAAARALSDLSQPQNWYTGNAAQPRNLTDNETKALQNRAKGSLQPLLTDKNSDVRANTAIALAKFDGQVTPALLEALNNPDPAIRRDAVRSFGQRQMRDPQYVDRFIAMLKNEQDPDVLYALLWNIGVSQDRRAVEPLLAVLANPESRVRAQAIWALGWIGDPKASGAILPFLQDPDTQIRKETALALGKFGEKQAVDQLFAALRDADAEVRRYAVMSLGELHERRAVQPICDLLPTAQGELLRSSIYALGNIGDPAAIEPLLAELDRAPELQPTILDTLLNFNDPRVVPPLLAALNNPDAGTRQTVTARLDRLIPFCTPEQLKALFNDKDAGVRRSTIYGLQRVSGPLPIGDLLIGALQDTDTGVRRAAVDCLQQHPDERAIPLLLKLIDTDADTEMRTTAVRMAFRVKSGNIDLFLQLVAHADAGVRKSTLDAMGGGTDPRVTAAVLQAMKDQDAGVRAAATGRLVGSTDPAVSEALVQALKDNSSTVRGAAVNALGRRNDARLLPPLLALLRAEPEVQVRVAVIRTISPYTTPEVADALLAAIEDPDTEVRFAAAAALGVRSDPRAVDFLLKVLRENGSHGMSAASALGYYRDPQVIAAIVGVLKTTVTAEDLELLSQIPDYPPGRIIRSTRFTVRIGGQRNGANAAMALRLIGAPAIPALAELLHDEQPTARTAAAAVLMQMQDGRAAPALTAALQDDDPLARRTALRGLRVLGDLRSLPLFQQCLVDPDLAVRVEAVLALGDLRDARATEPLLPFLLDPNADLRYAAAWALGNYADARAVESLLAAMTQAPDAGVRRLIVTALGNLGDPRAGDALLAQLRDADPNVVSCAVTALGQLKERRAVKPLLAMIQQPALAPDRSRRSVAEYKGLRSLGYSPDSMLFEVPAPRIAAIAALGEIGDPRAIDALIAIQQEPDNEIISAATRALASIKDPRAAATVLEYMAPKYPQGWGELEVLTNGEITPAVIELFLQALKGTDRGKRLYAVQFFASLARDPRAVPGSPPPAWSGRKESRAVEPLLAMLRDPDASLHSPALYALQAIAQPVPTEALLPLVDDPKVSVTNVCQTLMICNGEQAALALIQLLQHKNADVRIAAILTLGQWKVAAAGDALAALLQDPDLRIRQKAAEGLGLLGEPRAYEPLVALLNAPLAAGVDVDREVRKSAISALGRLYDSHAIRVLVGLMGDKDPDTAQWAYWSLAWSRYPQAGDVFATMLAWHDATASQRALDMLFGRINLNDVVIPALPAWYNSPQITSALIPILQDPRPYTTLVNQTYGPDLPLSPACKAAFILGEIGDAQAIEPLTAALDYGNSTFRLIVTQALGKLKDR